MKCPRCGGTGEVQESNLFKLRQARQMTQQQVANAVGLAQGNFARLENPVYPRMRWDTANKLSQFFGVGIAVIAGRDPLPAPKPARAKRPPPAGAVSKSRAHRAAVKTANRAKARGRK